MTETTAAAASSAVPEAVPEAGSGGAGGETPDRRAPWRRKLGAFMEGPGVTGFIIGVIVFNAVTLALETSRTVMTEVGGLLHVLDNVVLGIFVIEMVLKWIAFDVRYFRRGWNIFDFLIVAISLMPTTGELSVLRSLRILRVLRLVAIVPAMRRVVGALLNAIPGVSSVLLLLSLVYFVFAVICTKMFGQNPNPDMQAWFGDIGKSMYSLFQIMTLESWSMGIVRPTMKLYPNAWLVFVPFIMLTTFAVLNLFIAVIVNAMQDKALQEFEQAAGIIEEDIDQQTMRLTAEVKQQTDDLNTKVDAQTAILMTRMAELQAQMAQIEARLAAAPPPRGG